MQRAAMCVNLTRPYGEQYHFGSTVPKCGRYESGKLFTSRPRYNIHTDRKHLFGQLNNIC